MFISIGEIIERKEFRIMDEKFLFCDLKSFKKKDGDVLYYLIIYSNLTEQAEKIFITREDYEYILRMKGNIDYNKCLSRVYNKFKNTFVIKFTRV